MNLMKGDCLEMMKLIPDGSVDMVLCDLPYGTTQNKWDAVIPFDQLWPEYRRVCKGAIVLTASQPFTSALVMSAPDLFRHEWIWEKDGGSNFLNAKREPMKEHETVLVFGVGGLTFNRQMQERIGSRKGKASTSVTVGQSGCYGDYKNRSFDVPELRTPVASNGSTVNEAYTQPKSPSP